MFNLKDKKVLIVGNLKDKKVLIVGATGGIGSALTKTFAEAGAILGLATRDEEALNQLSSELSVKNYKYIVDLSDLKGLEEFIEKADQEMGGIDIMLCNAGITKDSLSMKMKTEDFQKVIDINLTSTFILNRDMAKKMMKRKYGRIINTASIVGVMGNPGQANYVASKAGMIGMTKSIALEYASRGITINCIAPGFIKTPMTDVLTDDQKNAMLSRIPEGKFGLPQDIANAAIFLASDEANYITGQTIHVNGGMLMV